jgi:hypothetical protein
VYGKGQEVFAMVQTCRGTRTRSPRFRGLLNVLALAGIGCTFACTLACTPVSAQASGPADMLRVELERTDRLIEKARDEIAGIRSSYPQTLLTEAEKLQLHAWKAYREAIGPGGSGGGLREAKVFTLQARDCAVRAIEAAGVDRRASEGAGKLIDRAQDRAAEVGERVEASGNPLARQLLEQGLDQLRRARRAFQDAQPHAARLAALAFDLIERAGRVAAGEGPDPAAVEASLARTETLLAEIESDLAGAGNPDALVASLREARGFVSRAREQLRAGHVRLALRLGLQARQAGLRILTQLQRLPSEAQLISALGDLEALRDQIAAELAHRDVAAARALLARASDLLELARAHLGAGESEDALSVLVAAESLLRDAAEEAGVE